ncbi:hypothetical protein [Brevundimonas faecalis]|uniref:Tat pathway signal protein n=1 Tax=Brevundimonas faecalis TaxID=947378 RepID=A0ABV2RG27_9CAUL
MLNVKRAEILGSTALAAAILFHTFDLDQQARAQSQTQPAAPCCEKQGGAQADAVIRGGAVQKGRETGRAAAPEDAWTVKMGGHRPEAAVQTDPADPATTPSAPSAERKSISEKGLPRAAPPPDVAKSISEKGVSGTRNH